MNGLSWLIYLAGSTTGFSTLFTLCSIFVGIVTLILICISFATLDKKDSSGRRLTNEALCDHEQLHDTCKKGAIKTAMVFVCFGVLSALMPSRQTVLLIAASEIGERTLKSEQMAAVGNRLTNVVDPSIELLNTWITKQTQDLKRQMNGSNNSSK